MGLYHRRALELAALKMAVNDAPAVASAQVQEPVTRDPLEGVLFASNVASRRAEEHGLTWVDFARSNTTPSSRTGYTTRDVMLIIDKKKTDAST